MSGELNNNMYSCCFTVRPVCKAAGRFPDRYFLFFKMYRIDFISMREIKTPLQAVEWRQAEIDSWSNRPVALLSDQKIITKYRTFLKKWQRLLFNEAKFRNLSVFMSHASFSITI